MRHGLVAGVCLMVGACGGAPAPPVAAPLYTEMAGDVALGLRVLTEAQVRTLQDAVQAAGEPCSAIDRTYLQAVERRSLDEIWNVRCPEAAYVVELSGDGDAPGVSRCTSMAMRHPCFETSLVGAPNRYSRPSGRLDPRLKDLLPPMSQP